MILAFDTHYQENRAKTVGVSFETWTDATPQDIQLEVIEGVAAYEPGAFYKRELPCILSLLKRYDLGLVETILVDGYVLLDDEGKPGLGGHLYQALQAVIPIVGVAKSYFHQNQRHTRELLRGDSQRPLYISAIGVELNQAHQWVASMHGPYRMPTLLQILDTKTKDWGAGA
ncbi:MAG TPA: endonuclease V [Cytophagales bacterium]|nr:endonuclease V [Cytophagales bacterium]HAP64483.1 endonuclease V [Cytophagales bacterium]